FGAVGMVAGTVAPDAGPLGALPAVLGAVVGILGMVLLLRFAVPWIAERWPGDGRESAAGTRGAVDPDPDSGTSVGADRSDRAPGAAGAAGAARPSRDDLGAPGENRRKFLGLAVGSAAVAAVAWVGGRVLQEVRFRASRSRAMVKIPAPASPAPPLPDGVDIKVPGVPPWRTSNEAFYQIDTALSVPQLDAQSWQLKIHGRVDHPRTLSFADLLRRRLIERDITLTCVSNPVGGSLIGNARWIGVPLRDLLREVGVHPGADQIVSRSSDGMTIGTPTAVVMDGRDAMLAVAMNGEPLPIKHGFPVRMVVPGLYGYVSACKWIVDMELTSFADYDAYWVPRGYSAKAPIKTEARIDTPKQLAKIDAGTVMVGGVAWAQHRGIQRVEVQVDDGDWQEARLAAVPSTDTWRQWVYTWRARPGRHTLRVRATDDSGVTQTRREADVAPDGATGWPYVDVTVH
ncbi:MAG: molybdopterin-dependent oxidoreductase, partial [Actinocatenispora sp.]